MQLFRYRVAYRRSVAAHSRTHHVTVTAADPDQARAIARELDPEFVMTAGYPRRLAPVGHDMALHGAGLTR